MKCPLSSTSDMDVQQEAKTCASQLTNEWFLMQHPTNAQRACAQTFHQSTTYVYLGNGCRCAPCVLLAAAFWRNSSCFWLLASVYLVSFHLYCCFCGYKVLGRDWTVAWRRPEGGRFLDRGQLPSDLCEQEKPTKGKFQS